MDYTLLTHEGFAIDIKGGPEQIDFCAQLNERNLITLALGGMVLAKNIFKTIVPDGESSGAYELHTLDGAIYRTDIADYDVQAISATFNNPKNDFVLVGGIIIQRHNFKMIRLAPKAD